MARAKNKRGKAGRVSQAKAQLPSKAIVCSVCGKGDGKYKCPRCRAPFCCVRCAKEHKARHCAAAETAAAPADAGGALPRAPSRYLPQRALDAAPPPPRRRLPRATGGDGDSHDDEPGWNVTPEMRARLRGAPWLRRELRDGGLRRLIGRVDAASEGEEEEAEAAGARRGGRGGRGPDRPASVTARELELARARHAHPNFASFVDRVMLAAGVLQPAEGGAGDGSDPNGTLAGGGGPGPLVLTPARTPGTRSETESSASDSDGDESSDSDDSESSDEGEESDSDGSKE